MKLLVIIGILILIVVAAIKSTVSHKIGYILFFGLFFSYLNHSIHELILILIEDHIILQKIYDPILPIFTLIYSVIGLIEGCIRLVDDDFTFLDLILDFTFNIGNGHHGKIWRNIHCKKLGVIFLKKESDDEIKIEKLNLKRQEIDDNEKWKIDKNIERIYKGIQGEKQVAFELENSGEDMYILHDVLLSYTRHPSPAQIDYLVITRKYIYVIEVKNWSGNIEIDNKGNFNHIIVDKNNLVHIGSEYSPVTQNQRHLDAVKGIAIDEMDRKLRKKIFKKSFHNDFRSLVIFSNARSYLDTDKAPIEIKEQVVKIDQLISYIRRNNYDRDKCWSNSEMYEIAKFYLDKNLTNRIEYYSKYEVEENTNNSDIQDSTEREVK